MKQQEDTSSEFRLATVMVLTILNINVCRQNVMQVLVEQQKLIQLLITKSEERQ